MSAEVIHLRGLEILTRIGVPAEERGTPQSLKVDLEMVPTTAFGAMGDEVASTIDYHAVATDIENLAANGERKLIETLAAEIVDMVLARYGAAEVRVRIRKFILPQTEWVGVECSKRRDVS